MPDRFDLADYGPHADGKTDDTPAFVRCFRDAQASGGGVITIPPDHYHLPCGETIPLSSGLTVLARGARFVLPEHLGDGARLTAFSGTDICDLTWHGGHFEGHCFDHRRPPNTWEPNANTRMVVVSTTPGGKTADLHFREISGHRVAGAVVTVEGVKNSTDPRRVDTFAARVNIRDCRIIDCGKFMWDYGLLWQILVWPGDYSPADVDMAWTYFRQDLVRRPVAMKDGDDRVRFNNTADPVAVSRSETHDEMVCFFGDLLPDNVTRGRGYYVVDATPEGISISTAPTGKPIQFAGRAGSEAGLMTKLSQAFYHLFWPIGCGPGKGAVDLVACRDTVQTGNQLSALGDTMHLQCCHNNVFANNQIIGSRMGAFFIAEYCKHSTVSGNTVDGTNGSRVMSVEKSSEDVTITGNTFRNGGRGSWINQPKRLILQGNVFINNTTKCERDPWRGRKTFLTGDFESYPELYFTLHEPGGSYGPVIIRDNIFVTGPECEAAIVFDQNGHDLSVDGNVFDGSTRNVRVSAGCERVHIGTNPGIVAEE